MLTHFRRASSVDSGEAIMQDAAPDQWNSRVKYGIWKAVVGM